MDQVSKIVLPRRGPSVEVEFDANGVDAVSINGLPVIVSPTAEKGDIKIMRGKTADAYILTDSYETVRRALKLLE
jgi:hypothetical protein